MINQTQHAIQFGNEDWLLLADCAIFSSSRKLLVLADLHLGKAGHFRKNGVPMPLGASEKDLFRLQNIINYYKPAIVVFLGDLFHSGINREAAMLESFIMLNADIEWILVEGNHDLIAKEKTKIENLKLIKDFWFQEPYIFVHNYETLEASQRQQFYSMSGHVHPGFTLKGKARQSIRVPCYVKSEKHILLPAFGSLTGLYMLGASSEYEIFVLADQRIFAYSSLK